MCRFRFLILFVVAIALVTGVGCKCKEKDIEVPIVNTEEDPFKGYSQTFVVVVPPTETNKHCAIVTDPKVVQKDSKTQLTLINLSGEPLYVSFGSEIAALGDDDIVFDGLENDQSWTVPLKTDTSGEFIYTILGKGNIVDPDKPPVTCLTGLPNPTIMIPKD
jgi:hypothetical protein